MSLQRRAKIRSHTGQDKGRTHHQVAVGAPGHASHEPVGDGGKLFLRICHVLHQRNQGFKDRRDHHAGQNDHDNAAFSVSPADGIGDETGQSHRTDQRQTAGPGSQGFRASEDLSTAPKEAPLATPKGVRSRQWIGKKSLKRRLPQQESPAPTRIARRILGSLTLKITVYAGWIRFITCETGKEDPDRFSDVLTEYLPIPRQMSAARRGSTAMMRFLVI